MDYKPSKYFEVEIYSHHFVVKNMSPSGQQITERFARNYIQYGMVKVGRFFKRGPVKVFAAKVAKKNEIRFHIGQWEAWKAYLADIAVPDHGYTETTFGFIQPAPLNAVLKEGWGARDYQIPIIDYLQSKEPAPRKLVEIQPGKGKAQPDDALVKIPGGWELIGDLEVGDSVIARDGSVTKINAIYPQGKKEIFKVTFEDNRSAEFCAEHLWHIWRKETDNWETVDTREVMRLTLAQEQQVYIDLPEPEQGVDINFPQDPYEFGKQGVFTDGLGAYLNGSYRQRLALMQGLLSENAQISEDGGISVITSGLALAQGIQYLARSLGAVAYLHLRDVDQTPKAGEEFTKIGYEVEILHKEPKLLFRTNALKQKFGKFAFPMLKLAVLRIEPVGVREARCISIDHPDRLYITDNFVVTHNTFCASAAMAELGHRMVAFLKPKYLEKWVGDLKAILNIDPEDIEVIQGSASLMEVIRKAKEGELTCKAILVSNRTFQHYMNAYEEKGDAILEQGYDCRPNEFIQVLGCGVKLVDEVHEDFHLNFKIDLYTHVEWSISLSATLVSDDAFISKMHEVAYAKKLRYSGLAYDKYVDSYALRYRIVNGDRLRSTEVGSSNYSHMAFEKNFFKNEKLLKAYLELICHQFEEHFLVRYQDDQRCLIYGASIQMCTLITEYMKKKYKDLDIRRYVEDDPYANLMEAQVCISTIGSAGTGHDIPKLITVILTVAIASKASNIQGFGRLRNLPGLEMVFIYFTCMDIAKHVEYHEKKEFLLAGMAKSTRIIDLPYVVGE